MEVSRTIPKNNLVCWRAGPKTICTDRRRFTNTAPPHRKKPIWQGENSTAPGVVMDEETPAKKMNKPKKIKIKIVNKPKNKQAEFMKKFKQAPPAKKRKPPKAKKIKQVKGQTKLKF